MKNGKRVTVAITEFSIVATFILSILICRYSIKTTEYTVALHGIESSVKIVALSDLHGQEFGKENGRLIEKIRKQSPDAIFLVGDMLDRNADASDIQPLLKLVEALCELAPVYFAPGNHEQTYVETDRDFSEKIVHVGAVYLNDSYTDVTLNGQRLRIGGTMGYGFPFGRTEKAFESSAEYLFLTEFEKTDAPKICLAHMPDTFIFNGAYLRWDIDLVLSGHTHGGLIRLPFVGGLYAPMQEWFPKYDMGYYRLGDHMQMIITSGLAGYRFIPRINNLPEIAVIDLVPES